jgi:ATP-dependent helicase/nuclease subunit B
MIEQEITASFALSGGKTLSLHGRTDRVDILNENNTEYVKIIDYKSGAGKFNPDEVLKGVQLQLMLYMNAVLSTRKNAKPSGVFYFPVSDPIINADNTLTEAAREEALLKAYKMSGISVGEKNMELHAFEEFSREAENKVKELGEQMLKGNICAKPFTKGQKSPCVFCKYTGVCGAF